MITKLKWLNLINYVKHEVDDDYESYNAALQEELRSVSILMMLNVLYSFINCYVNCEHHYHWHNENLKNNMGIID